MFIGNENLRDLEQVVVNRGEEELASQRTVGGTQGSKSQCASRPLKRVV